MIGKNSPCWCGSGKKYKHCHEEWDNTINVLKLVKTLKLILEIFL